MVTVGLVVALVGGFGLLLTWAQARYRPDSATLIDAIDALLPQTQCAQCGYPGCRPYAEAVAEGAAINLCPPGGADTHQALAALLGRTEPGTPPHAATNLRAVIDEAECIGCGLCVPACPVDAIVGAAQLMHTVVAQACTGCELCLPPCPVDCIELVAVPAQPAPRLSNRRRWPDRPPLPCIRCGACEPACPVQLRPQELHWFGRNADVPPPRAADDLARCIECGLCNQVCPSNIDLVGEFSRGRRELARRARAERESTLAKERFAHHQRRIEARAAGQSERRKARIATRRGRDWQA